LSPAAMMIRPNARPRKKTCAASVTMTGMDYFSAPYQRVGAR
jgi:hypothetical protein